MRLDLNHFEARVTAIESKLIHLEGRTTALELEQSALRAAVIEQTQQFDALNRSIRALTSSVDRLVDDRVPLKMLSDRAVSASERAAKQAETAAHGSAQVLQHMHMRCGNCRHRLDDTHDERVHDERVHDERTVLHHTDGHGS